MNYPPHDGRKVFCSCYIKQYMSIWMQSLSVINSNLAFTVVLTSITITGLVLYKTNIASSVLAGSLVPLLEEDPVPGTGSWFNWIFQ